jgi:hypothetical protein
MTIRNAIVCLERQPAYSYRRGRVWPGFLRAACSAIASAGGLKPGYAKGRMSTRQPLRAPFRGFLPLTAATAGWPGVGVGLRHSEIFMLPSAEGPRLCLGLRVLYVVELGLRASNASGLRALLSGSEGVALPRKNFHQCT